MKKIICIFASCFLLPVFATPVLFTLQSLTGTANNRSITVIPDATNPLVVGTNLVPHNSFVLYPSGGQVLTNLAPVGYSIKVDGWPRSAHIIVPDTTNTVNAATLINTNQFAPITIYLNFLTNYDAAGFTNADASTIFGGGTIPEQFMPASIASGLPGTTSGQTGANGGTLDLASGAQGMNGAPGGAGGNGGIVTIANGAVGGHTGGSGHDGNNGAGGTVSIACGAGPSQNPTTFTGNGGTVNLALAGDGASGNVNSGNLNLGTNMLVIGQFTLSSQNGVLKIYDSGNDVWLAISNGAISLATFATKAQSADTMVTTFYGAQPAIGMIVDYNKNSIAFVNDAGQTNGYIDTVNQEIHLPGWDFEGDPANSIAPPTIGRHAILNTTSDVPAINLTGTFPVNVAPGFSTNIQFKMAGYSTNTLFFTNGILMRVSQP